MNVEYGKLTFLEIKQKAAEGYMAIIPTGCTEQQGRILISGWLPSCLLKQQLWQI
ncbi:hypothetical protein [Paenibacillus sp. IHB B 3415]|uniref:hypothetical protein n=1 Tax=Paenibacillus sp. IHB B 3415 TaxID=867080 RepID=UPI000A9B4FC9|nr:hypothetical protein [Paenibacillus sp. IHB B 3415]